MASAFGPGMQPFVGPQNMNRQDIARLTNFDKVLLEWQRQVGAGGQPPSIDEVRAKYEETSAWHPFLPAPQRASLY